MELFDTIIKNSLVEDAPNGDITTFATVELGTQISGRFIAKEDGVICGLNIAKRTFELCGGNFVIDFKVSEGDVCKNGDVIACINGDAHTVLVGERTALNLMQRASGIATMTRKAVLKINGTQAKICDTRKTMPGLRMLDKYAVRVGGGTNHRFCLSDGVLIKDNHIKAAGSITNAVTKAKKNVPHTIKIEVEVETLDELREALAAKADIIMLDNMTNETMREAVAIVNHTALTEASGNMGEKDLRAVAETGVDLISIGALTHSVKAMDISLKFN